VTQFITSNYIGPELPDITSALVCLAATTVFLKFWHPKQAYVSSSGSAGAAPAAATPAKRSNYTTGQILKAWSPFIILTVVVVIWTLPGFRSLFDAGGPLYRTTLSFNVPGLHDAVIKTTPIVDKATPYAATYKLDLIAATGSGILLAAVLSMFVLGISPREGVGVFKQTVKDLVKSIATISLVLGFAFIANYSGVSSTLALAIASSGHWFPFFSPVLGWLGVFLTGSDTSSNALFSSLQSITAHQIGVSDVLMVAANSTGGVTGKMISPQSIAVACAAVGLVGRESELLRFTAKWSIVFLLIICVITYLQAYHLQWMIP
jgi:lactate permease